MVHLPPVLARTTFDSTNYLESFPDLMGSVHLFRGDDRDHAELVRRMEAGRNWPAPLELGEAVLSSVACHALYPMWAGRLPVGGRRYEVSGFCFRHEPSNDPARMQPQHAHPRSVPMAPLPQRPIGSNTGIEQETIHYQLCRTFVVTYVLLRLSVIGRTVDVCKRNYLAFRRSGMARGRRGGVRPPSGDDLSPAGSVRISGDRVPLPRCSRRACRSSRAAPSARCPRRSNAGGEISWASTPSGHRPGRGHSPRGATATLLLPLTFELLEARRGSPTPR